jgi:glycosyltransferase involved in cell wall biosynthesis
MPEPKTDLQSQLTLALITGTWPPMLCGVGDYTSMLCEHLSRLGVKVHVITSRQARRDLRLEGSNLLEVHSVVDRWNYDAWRVVRRLLASLKPDVINLQWPTAEYGRSLWVNLLPWLIKLKFPELPLVATLHELRYFSHLSRLRLYPTLVLARALILVDPLDLEVVRKLYPLGRKRYQHIPIASNLPSAPTGFDRAARRRALGFSDQDFVVGFFGFANPPKGLETLLAAMRSLRETCPNAKLLLLSQLSEQNPYQRRLLRFLKVMGLQDLVVNPKYAEPRLAAEILASADCAALPFTDGVSMKRGSLMACLAQGLPIVTTTPARGESGDFQPNQNLLVVPPRDPQALAASLHELWLDPDLRARLALGAWDLARQFSWDDIARRYLAVFESVRAGAA